MLRPVTHNTPETVSSALASKPFSDIFDQNIYSLYIQKD